MDELTGIQLLESIENKSYVIAQRGIEYLEKYKFIQEFSNSFGLVD